MTEELIEKYAEILCDEKEAFILYKHLIHLLPSEKQSIIDMMEDEVNHYEMIHKWMFKDIKNMTVIETVYMNNSEQDLANMKNCLNELRK